MEALTRKIEEMVADMQTRVQTVHEQATAAAELKTETYKLREAVHAAAKTADKTCRALANAVQGCVETQREALASGKRAVENVTGEAKATVTKLKADTESTLQRLRGKAEEFEELAKQTGAAVEKISAEAALALDGSADELRAQAEELAAAARRSSETLGNLDRQAQALKEGQEAGLESLRTVLDERIRESFAARREEQEKAIREKMGQTLEAFGEQLRADLERQLAGVQREGARRLTVVTRWAAVSAAAAGIAAGVSIGLLLSIGLLP